MAEKDLDQVELDFDDTEETEVEVADVGNDSDDSDENFKKAETATQKRIDRLTKKMREAERREQEAIKYAQAVQTEATTLKQRMQNLDTNYVNEYTNRVTTQTQQAENELARAIELGDAAGTVAAQRKLTALAIQADRAAQAKMQSDRARQQAAAAHSIKRSIPCLPNSLNALIQKRSNGLYEIAGLAQMRL